MGDNDDDDDDDANEGEITLNDEDSSMEENNKTLSTLFYGIMTWHHFHHVEDPYCFNTVTMQI